MEPLCPHARGTVRLARARRGGRMGRGGLKRRARGHTLRSRAGSTRRGRLSVDGGGGPCLGARGGMRDQTCWVRVMQSIALGARGLSSRPPSPPSGGLEGDQEQSSVATDLSEAIRMAPLGCHAWLVCWGPVPRRGGEKLGRACMAGAQAPMPPIVVMGVDFARAKSLVAGCEGRGKARWGAAPAHRVERAAGTTRAGRRPSQAQPAPGSSRLL